MSEVSIILLLMCKRCVCVCVYMYSAVESAQEERERSEKTSHEMRKLIADLTASEDELHRVKAELARVRDDYESERVKLRQMHLEKLAAERRVSECVSAAGRVTAEADECRFRADTAELTAQRLQRTVSELESVVDDLKKKRSESDKQRTVLLERLNKLNAVSDAVSRSRDRDHCRELELELESVRVHNCSLEKELTTTQKSYKLLKSSSVEMSEVVDSLRVEVSELKQEREFFRRDLTHSHTTHAEKQIVALRKDLTATTSEWQAAEELRVQREETVAEWSARLDAEKDKVALLQAQIRVMEQRSEVVAQELSIFRNLDIYQKSMSAGLVHVQRSGAAPLRHSLTHSRAPSEVVESKLSSSYMTYDSSDDSSGEGGTHHRSLTHSRTRSGVGERVNERVGERVGERVNERVSERVSERVNEREEKSKDDHTHSQRHRVSEGVPRSLYDDDDDHTALGPALQLEDISLNHSTTPHAHAHAHTYDQGSNNSEKDSSESPRNASTHTNTHSATHTGSSSSSSSSTHSRSHSRTAMSYSRPSKADFERAKRLLSR